ncbi:hypothetical protein K440DRAFT_77288 [Wilcoxina mikolae CBS 423.85]|nr:hypothetical protein K440DRAFT_77288 [Wilcoxina mikolae CBS 423.85]
MLLEHGADVNAQDGYYNNALQAAVQWDKTNVIKLLLERDIDINFKRNALEAAVEKRNALGAAVARHEPDIVQLLENNLANHSTGESSKSSKEPSIQPISPVVPDDSTHTVSTSETTRDVTDSLGKDAKEREEELQDSPKSYDIRKTESSGSQTGIPTETDQVASSNISKVVDPWSFDPSWPSEDREEIPATPNLLPFEDNDSNIAETQSAQDIDADRAANPDMNKTWVRDSKELW